MSLEGTQLGNYRLIRQVGSGTNITYARVWTL